MSKQYNNLPAQLDRLHRHNRQGSYRTRARYYEAMPRGLHHHSVLVPLRCPAHPRVLPHRHRYGRKGAQKNTLTIIGKGGLVRTVPLDELSTHIIDCQLQQGRIGGREYQLVSTKNGKGRTVTPAVFIMALLKHHWTVQAEQRLKAGVLWEDSGFVFTNELGHHLTQPKVYSRFKKAVASIDRPDARSYDLCHSYAVAAIRFWGRHQGCAESTRENVLQKGKKTPQSLTALGHFDG